mgnify:CR=1 FL=1
MKKNSVCLIPARKGSKRITNKNIINFYGKPLIYYSIIAAKKVDYLIEFLFQQTAQILKGLQKNMGQKFRL